jgi:glycosyltransferase involved in cell wall biosynthesis
MRILIYDWCLHVIGGGQKVNCRIAEHLSKKYKTDILTMFPTKKQDLERYYSVDLSRVGKIMHLYEKSNINSYLLFLISFRKVSKIAREYDILINADAHETVKPSAKYNIMYCHFFRPQVYKYRYPKGFFDRFALLGVYFFRKMLRNYVREYDSVYCNSKYTKEWLKKLWGIDAKIIYPFVQIPEKVPPKKENIILVTGRLSPDKNYEFVIDSFKQIYDSGIKNYTCIIAAATGKDGDEYYGNICNRIKDYPIEIRTNLTDKQLKVLYSKAKIFLMAKGLCINEEKFPLLMENFGMSVLEAAAHGCVPVVLNKGGYKEIVKENENGLLFNTEEEAIKQLKRLLNNEGLRSKLSKSAMQNAKKFSLERMQKEIDKAIEKAIKSGKINRHNPSGSSK